MDTQGKLEEEATMNNFFNTLKGFFTAPVFEGDTEKTRSAQLLYQIIRLIWILPLLLVTIGILGGRAEVIPPAIAISISLLTLMALSQMGRVGLASTLFTAMIILLIGYADFQNAGNIQPSTLMFAIAIIMSGLLLGRRAPLVTAGLILVLHSFIVYFQMQGLIELRSAPAVGFENIVITSIMVVVIGFLFQFVISRLQFALDQARKDERELQISNRELQELSKSLEQRVADRTRNLELGTEVGRSVSQVRALDVMLKDAAELIRSQFDLYYVQVYLTDASQTNLLLLSGTGNVGEQLVGRGHRLPLNIGSINGRAATEKKSVVIADTTASGTFRPNPLLPDTRAEMAIPLLVGEKVVGVLDLQSEKANGLSQELLPAFEALAGQLAIAIQNANLLAEAEQARAEVEAQARRLVRTNWADYLDAVHKPESTGFVFEQNQVIPLAQAPETQGLENGNSFAAPIAVTGEPLGNLVVEMESQSSVARSDELVNTVARQVAQHIEALRLLESAERYRAEAEEASLRLTREGWKSYMDNAKESLGYFYDLKEVRPHNGNGHDESAVTLPVKLRGEVLGTLAIQGLDPNDSQAIELINAVAERLGTHIESLRQFDETRRGQVELDRRAQQLAAVAEVSTASSKELDIQKMLESVVNLTQRKFGLYHAHVFTYNEYTDELQIVACGWHEGDEHEGTHETVSIPLSRERSLVARAARTKQAVIVNDVKSEEGFLPNPLLPDTASEMAVPLIIGDQVLGVLDVQSDRMNAFSQEDANIQTTLASQVSTALQNARSFGRAQQQAQREAMLNAISQKIQSATSVEAVLQIAARELGHALHAPMTVAQLSMKDKS